MTETGEKFVTTARAIEDGVQWIWGTRGGIPCRIKQSEVAKAVRDGLWEPITPED